MLDHNKKVPRVFRSHLQPLCFTRGLMLSHWTSQMLPEELFKANPEATSTKDSILEISLLSHTRDIHVHVLPILWPRPWLRVLVLSLDRRLSELRRWVSRSEPDSVALDNSSSGVRHFDTQHRHSCWMDLVVPGSSLADHW